MENPVKGTHDIVGLEAEMYSEIEHRCRYVAAMFGYQEIRTPILEHTPLFLRSVGESSDIVHKEMYTFDDKGGRSVTLRPEMTAGVMRSIVSNKLYALADLPLKYFYLGPCFRYERPQAGRYRQFHQFGVECVGAPSAYLDAEAINLGFSCLQACGLSPKLKINSLGDEESRENYRKALKEYFAKYIDKMCPDCQRRYEVNPLRILDCKVPEDIEIVKGAPKLHDYLSESAKAYLDQVISILKDYEIEAEIDDNLVRGLDYYTGVVFEYHAEEDPELANVGALGGGGHYAHLLKDVGGPDLEGVGMSLGLERVQYLFEHYNGAAFRGVGIDLFIMPMDEKFIPAAALLVNNLRTEGFISEMCYEPKSLKSLFKLATKKKAKFAIILGEDEFNKGEFTVKNLSNEVQTKVRGEELVHSLRSMMEEYLRTEEFGFLGLEDKAHE